MPRVITEPSPAGLPDRRAYLARRRQPVRHPAARRPARAGPRCCRRVGAMADAPRRRHAGCRPENRPRAERTAVPRPGGYATRQLIRRSNTGRRLGRFHRGRMKMQGKTPSTVTTPPAPGSIPFARSRTRPHAPGLRPCRRLSSHRRPQRFGNTPCTCSAPPARTYPTRPSVRVRARTPYT